MIKNNGELSTKKSNSSTHLSKLIDQLTLCALELESAGFPTLTKLTQVNRGAHNSIFKITDSENLLLREEHKQAVHSTGKLQKLRTMAFLRSLPSQSFLALPQLVSTHNKISSLEIKADTDLNRHLRFIVCIEQVQNIIAQIVLGLETLHQYQIAHRDLKPENILLNILSSVDTQQRKTLEEPFLDSHEPPLFNYEVKIADLDFILDPLDATRGTKAYFSPTLIYLDTTNKKLNRNAQDRLKDDIWALGATLTDLLVKKRQPYAIRRLVNNVIFESGMMAPLTNKDLAGSDKIHSQQTAWQTKLKIYLAENLKTQFSEHEEIKDFILNLLEYDEDKRPTIQQIKNMPFLTDAIAQATTTRANEIDLTDTPFWLFAEKIRNFAKNLTATSQDCLAVDDLIIFGLSNQVKNFLALIDDLPLKNHQAQVALNNLLTLLTDETLQPYLLDEVCTQCYILLRQFKHISNPNSYCLFSPEASKKASPIHTPPRPSRGT